MKNIHTDICFHAADSVFYSLFSYVDSRSLELLFVHLNNEEFVRKDKFKVDN